MIAIVLYKLRKNCENKEKSVWFFEYVYLVNIDELMVCRPKVSEYYFQSKCPQYLIIFNVEDSC